MSTATIKSGLLDTLPASRHLHDCLPALQTHTHLVSQSDSISIFLPSLGAIEEGKERANKSVHRDEKEKDDPSELLERQRQHQTSEGRKAAEEGKGMRDKDRYVVLQTREERENRSLHSLCAVWHSQSVRQTPAKRITMASSTATTTISTLSQLA